MANTRQRHKQKKKKDRHPSFTVAMEIAAGSANCGGRKGRKRPRVAPSENEPHTIASTGPAIALLPTEMLFVIVQKLALPDLARTATSGAPLAPVAQAILAQRLKAALDTVGVSDVDRDPVGAIAVLHNAISHDNAINLKAILDAGLAREIDEPLPPMAVMASWKTPIAVVLHLHNEGTAYIIERPDSGRVMREVYQTGGLYDTAHDVCATPLRHSCRTLPQTPLVRAIRCGSRRCVRTLLAAGARPYPSPEALLGAALERIFLTRVAIAERHSRGRPPYGHVWVPCADRYTDRLGIVEDITAAFARTPPPLPLLDTNPLSMLRYGADESIDKDSPDDGLPRALGALLNAGYSSAEPVTRLPPSDASQHGLWWSHAVAPIAGYGACRRPIKSRAEVDITRENITAPTECQAAALALYEAHGFHCCEGVNAFVMLHTYARYEKIRELQFLLE